MLGEYDAHKYEEYREWWSNNRFTRLIQGPKYNIKKLNFDQMPECDLRDCHDFFNSLFQLQPQMRRVIGQIVSIKNLDHLAMSILTCNAIGVCDASLNDDNFGSHAYIIESRDEQSHVKGAGPVDCDEDDADSTRAEMTGLLAMLQMLQILQILSDNFVITKGEIDIFCDNQEAIRTQPKHPFLLSYGKFCLSHHDIKSEIHHHLLLCPMIVTLVHVKGHQDDQENFAYEDAPLPVRRNIDMDELAKVFLKDPPPRLRPHRRAPIYEHQAACLIIHDTPIIANVEHHVTIHHLGPRMEQRLHVKNIMKSQHQGHINWRAYGRAMTRHKTSKKLPFVKLIHNLWPTSVQISEWYTPMSALCLRCKLDNETCDHVFQCKSAQITSSFKEAISKLQKDLETAHTSAIIVTAIIRLLQEFRTGYPPKLQQHPYQNPTIQELSKQVMKKQRMLGPQALWRGFLVYEWEALQNLCDNHSSTISCNTEWVSRCIQSLWTFSKQVWESRCNKINSPDPTTKTSLKTVELRRVLREELEWLRTSTAYDDQMLAKNIESYMKTELDKTIYKWLTTIRSRKEQEARTKSKDRIPQRRARAITSFFDRA